MFIIVLIFVDLLILSVYTAVKHAVFPFTLLLLRLNISLPSPSLSLSLSALCSAPLSCPFDDKTPKTHGLHVARYAYFRFSTSFVSRVSPLFYQRFLCSVSPCLFVSSSASCVNNICYFSFLVSLFHSSFNFHFDKIVLLTLQFRMSLLLSR